MNRKRTVIFRILMLCYLGTIAYMCFGKFENLPSVSRTFLGLPPDKVVHFCMFLPFPVLAFFCYDKVTGKPWQAVVLAIITFIAGEMLAAATEMVQTGIVYRSGDIWDFVADTTAIIVGTIGVLATDLLQMRKRL